MNIDFLLHVGLAFFLGLVAWLGFDFIIELFGLTGLDWIGPIVFALFTIGFLSAITFHDHRIDFYLNCILVLVIIGQFAGFLLSSVGVGSSDIIGYLVAAVITLIYGKKHIDDPY